MVESGKTIKEGFFPVNNREKPSEYVYEETEVLNYTALEKRLQKLEEDLKNIVVEETDPTVPEWAKQPNKPSYTAAEVGALSTTETARQLALKQDKSNLVTAINDTSVDSTYPSARAVYRYVGAKVADLVGSAPETLDTIEEIAEALAENQDVVDALNAAIANKQDKLNLVTTISDSSTDTQFPSARAVANFAIGRKGTGTRAEKFNNSENVASGTDSHAEGERTTAGATAAHAEGTGTTASGYASHTEGESTIARTTGSHAEGKSTEAGQANGQSYAHAEGVSSKAYGRGSHAEGELTLAQGNYSHAEGSNSQATGAYAHAEGYKNGNAKTTASGSGSHAEGHGTTAEGAASHSEGQGTHAKGDYTHAEGRNSKAVGRGSHAEGDSTVAGDGESTLLNDVSALDTYQSQVPGAAAHTEGIGTLAKKAASHAEGYKTVANGNASHAEGNKTTASGFVSHAEGYQTIAEGNYSHAEGENTLAKTNATHAEGHSTQANGQYSHVEGYFSISDGWGSHAEGYYTIAKGATSHAEGDNTIANSDNSHVQGKYNIEDTEEKYAHIVGNGVSVNSRSNAHTLDWNGNAWFAGNLYVGGQNQDEAMLIEPLEWTPGEYGSIFSEENLTLGYAWEGTSYSFTTPLNLIDGQYRVYINKELVYEGKSIDEGNGRFMLRFNFSTATVSIYNSIIEFYHWGIEGGKFSLQIELLATKTLNEQYIPNNIPKITTATVGQILEVESVDENGKPTKWKAVDKSAGGGITIMNIPHDPSGIDYPEGWSYERLDKALTNGENIVVKCDSYVYQWSADLWGTYEFISFMANDDYRNLYVLRFSPQGVRKDYYALN